MFLKNLVKELDNSPAILIVICAAVVIMAMFNFSGLFDALVIVVFSISLFTNLRDYRRKY